MRGCDRRRPTSPLATPASRALNTAAERPTARSPRRRAADEPRKDRVSRNTSLRGDGTGHRGETAQRESALQIQRLVQIEQDGARRFGHAASRPARTRRAIAAATRRAPRPSRPAARTARIGGAGASTAARTASTARASRREPGITAAASPRRSKAFTVAVLCADDRPGHHGRADRHRFVKRNAAAGDGYAALRELAGQAGLRRQPGDALERLTRRLSEAAGDADRQRGPRLAQREGKGAGHAPARAAAQGNQHGRAVMRAAALLFAAGGRARHTPHRPATALARPDRGAIRPGCTRLPSIARSLPQKAVPRS